MHVVVDSNNTRALLRESFDRFRADQSGRSRDDDCAHLVYSTITLAITQDGCLRIPIGVKTALFIRLTEDSISSWEL